MHAIKKSQGYFLGSVAAVLFAAGVIQLLSAFGTARLLREADMLLPLSCGRVLLLGGVLEILASGLLLMLQGRWLRWILAALLTGGILAYQLASKWKGGAGVFSYLGNFTPWVPVSPRVLNPLMLALYGLVFVGSALFLALNGFTRQRAIPETPAAPAAQTGGGKS